MPLLQVSNLTSRFGSLSALKGVSFSLEPGEVVGIEGRRAAGKSTLLNILAGLLPPTSGEILWDGRPIRLAGPRSASRLGIELVHQKPVLSDQLDVLHNIFLGRERGWLNRLGLADWKAMTERASELLAQLDAPASLLRMRTSDLSDEQRQVVVIARALSRPARLILLDDSLAALSFQRQEKLLGLIKSLAQRGVALILSSDNLKDLFSVTQRILVLYEGQMVADRQTDQSTPREIVELIVGSTRQEQVTPIIWALESYQAAQQQTEELRRTQAVLRESLQERDSLNQQLVQRLGRQVETLAQLNSALQAAQRRLMTEREQERKYLARELHDQAVQDLLSFNYRLEEAESNSTTDARRGELADIRGGIRRVVAELRDLCSDLRPPTIDSHGLVSALRSHAGEWSKRNGVAVNLQIDPELGRLPEAIELSIFRIVQEGLNNVRKHAGARQAWLEVQRTPTASLLVRLIDDGQGLSDKLDLAALSNARHFGLLGISERVALLGGTLQINSAATGGFSLQIEIPSPYPMV
jgi:signal transduction histidine kinase